jgi:hypothetical protein
MQAQRTQLTRSQILLAIAMLTVLSATTTASEGRGDALGIVDLQTTADQIRNFKPKDEFDTPPSSSNIAGRAFSVTVKPRKRGISNSICQGFPSWGYFPQQSNLEVAFNTGSILTSGLASDPFTAAFPQSKSLSGSFLRFASFTCKKLKQGQYSASNAFGATTSVDRETDIVLAFSDQDSSSRVPADAVTYWSKSISGDAARKLSESVAIRITGVIGVWPNGQSVICGTKRNSPRLNFPYDQTLDACVFKATSLQFEVLDQTTGEVLHRTGSTRGSTG